MGWFSSTLNEVGHFAKRTIEVLNLKTEESLKDPSSLSDEVLIAKNSSTRRSVASTVLGTMANIAIAVACPPYAAAAALNAWQLSVSVVNRHRVRREVKKRKHEDKDFKAMYKECNKPVRDIAIGCTLKAAFTTLSMGIVGFDHIADNFQHVAQHAATPTHFMASNAADAYATMSGKSHIQNIANTYDHPDGNQYPPKVHESLSHEEQFKENHPGFAHADKIIHRSFSLGDIYAKIFGKTVAGNIETDSSWDKIGEFFDARVSMTELFFKTASIGVFAELVQPITLLAEYAVDKWCDLRDFTRARKFYKSSKPDVTAQMKGKEIDDQAKKETAVRDELKQKFQNRARNIRS